MSVSDSGWSPIPPTSSRPMQPLPKLPVARAVWEPHPDFGTSTRCWLTAGGPHHTVLSTAVGVEEITDLADILRTELLIIDERHPVSPVHRRDPLEPGVLPARPGLLTGLSQRRQDMTAGTDRRAVDRRRPRAARHRAGVYPDQGRADRDGPPAARSRQPQLGEPVRRPALDVLARRGVGRPAGLLRLPRRRRPAAVRSGVDRGRRARGVGDDARLPRIRRRRRTARPVPDLAQHQHRRGRRNAECTVRAQHPAPLEHRAPVPGDVGRRGARRSDRTADDAGRVRALDADRRTGPRRGRCQRHVSAVRGRRVRRGHDHRLRRSGRRTWSDGCGWPTCCRRYAGPASRRAR